MRYYSIDFVADRNRGVFVLCRDAFIAYLFNPLVSGFYKDGESVKAERIQRLMIVLKVGENLLRIRSVQCRNIVWSREEVLSFKISDALVNFFIGNEQGCKFLVFRFNRRRQFPLPCIDGNFNGLFQRFS